MRLSVFRHLLVGGIFVLLSIFIFEQQVDNALGLVGYNGNFVSYFPFVKNMYFHLIASNRRIANLDVAHFHMLDVALWLSIVVWGTWLTAGIISLKKYDNAFRLFLPLMSERYRRRLRFMYFSWAFMLLGPIILSIPPSAPLENPEILFVLANIPRFYFFVIALSYYLCGGFGFSFLILFLIWRFFHQNRPNVVLLEGAQKGKEVGL
jgi:hypothetical protein